MKKTKIILIIILFFLFSGCFSVLAQIPYPYKNTEGDQDILAYWYNFPKAMIKMEKGNLMTFHSSLHLYGKAPSDKFEVNAEVYLKDGNKIFKKTFKSEIAKISNGFFKIQYPVDYSKKLPYKIIVSIISSKGKRTKEIKCFYHKLHGKLVDFNENPVKGFINVGPDGFAGENLGVETDENGEYELILPERTYNCLIPNTKAYATTALEAWGWHMIVDSNQELNFKIGTGEVYNLNVWANNGGGFTYFISFRPMILARAKQQRSFQVKMNDESFEINDFSPDLKVKDLKILINGEKADIISLQKYYETGRPGAGSKAYIVQVKKPKSGAFGKQTITVEFDKIVEIEGKKYRASAMGCCQFYLNFTGLSKYF